MLDEPVSPNTTERGPHAMSASDLTPADRQPISTDELEHASSSEAKEGEESPKWLRKQGVQPKSADSGTFTCGPTGANKAGEPAGVEECVASRVSDDDGEAVALLEEERVGEWVRAAVREGVPGGVAVPERVPGGVTVPLGLGGGGGNGSATGA